MVSLTNITYNIPYYLNNQSYIMLSSCNPELLNYTRYNFNRLRDLIKTSYNKSKVMVFNKDYEKPLLLEKTINRWYKSYLNTPRFPVETTNKSYMFSGLDRREQQTVLPYPFHPYFNYFRNIDSRYNQVVANYYETINDYIDYHRDWTYDMVENYSISILNLNEPRFQNDNTENRIFKIKSVATGETYDIELTDGLIITMGGEFQRDYRHGIPPGTPPINNNRSFISTRIGITFRQFLE